MTENRLKETGRSVQAPEFILPWLDRFYEPFEIDIIRLVTRDALDEPMLRSRMDIDPDTMGRLFRRRIISKNEEEILIPGNFHGRYDIWVLFEGFKDIPEDIKNRLNQRELDHYIKSHEPHVAGIRKSGKLDPFVITPQYLLLDEAFEVLDQVDQVFLWPCNCRSMINVCSKPVYTCLRFDNSQGQGFEISREKAKHIVQESNRKGLMQCGELGRDAEGKLLGAICNCCPDCCFPHLLAREKNAERLWPFSRYSALWLEQDCSSCGLCAKRCPFHAFTHDREKDTEPLAFNADLCRGCGLCAVSCPENAIEMKTIQ